jgi:hypothetical protein
LKIKLRPEQHRQLANVDGDAPRLIARHELGRRPPSVARTNTSEPTARATSGQGVDQRGKRPTIGEQIERLNLTRES